MCGFESHLRHQPSRIVLGSGSRRGRFGYPPKNQMEQILPGLKPEDYDVDTDPFGQPWNPTDVGDIVPPSRCSLPALRTPCTRGIIRYLGNSGQTSGVGSGLIPCLTTHGRSI
jgi:hypothetical protein